MKIRLNTILLLGFFISLSNSSFALDKQIRTQLITVTTTATKIPSTPLVGRNYVMITNNDSSATLYIGSSTVTTSGSTIGTPLLPYDRYYGTWDSNVDIYGIVSSGSISAIVEEGK